MGKYKTKKAPFLECFPYPGRDLNPHGRNAHWILSPTCLPIPPPGQQYYFLRTYPGINLSLVGRGDAHPYGCVYHPDPDSYRDYRDHHPGNISKKCLSRLRDFLFERKTGFEPATPTLARSCSTS